MPKVLISDKLSAPAVEIFRARGIEVDFQPDLGKDPARLAEVISRLSRSTPASKVLTPARTFSMCTVKRSAGSVKRHT